MMASGEHVVVGSRGSNLALCQTEHVVGKLVALCPGITFSIKRIRTTGDRIKDVPLAKIAGGKGLFTKEIDNALLRKEVDVAVHSMKDVPTDIPDGIVIGAVPERSHPGDVLISRNRVPLGQLRQGACIGTSSLRRKVQLLAYRADLKVENLRGNLTTRIARVTWNGMGSGSGKRCSDLRFDGIIVGASGINRLGLNTHVAEIIPYEIMLPAVGQGALAVEARKDDVWILEILEKINDNVSRRCVDAERAFLKKFGGGCQVPIASLAQESNGMLRLRACIASPDGRDMLKSELEGDKCDGERLAADLAEKMLACGAAEILRRYE
jgi:hydroxymethylbilane synthase